MQKNTSIFYVNSFGFLCQWRGQILDISDNSLTIRFSKNKALKFNLRDLDIDFCLVTNTLVKNLDVCISGAVEAIQFDEKLKNVVLENTKGNIKYLWADKGWKH